MARLDRCAWRTLYERDVDLVLLDLLHSSQDFRARMLQAVLPDADDLAAYEFRGAWHSVIDPQGRESDIEVDWWSEKHGTLTLLIEDKIDARCQPEQAERYAKLAKKYVEQGLANTARTVLVAPATYPDRHKADTAPFQHHITLEEIADWVSVVVSGERGAYLHELLEHALRRWKRVVSVEDGNQRSRQFPDIYRVLREELIGTGSRLSISNSSENEWIYFQSSERRRGVLLRYRFLDHWAELVFPRHDYTEEGLQAKLASRPLPGASITGRGKTELAVWIPTAELDVETEFEAQRLIVQAAVGTLERLQVWYENSVLQ